MTNRSGVCSGAYRSGISSGVYRLTDFIYRLTTFSFQYHIQYIHIYNLRKNNKNDMEMAKGQWRPERAIPFESKLNKNTKRNVIP